MRTVLCTLLLAIAFTPSHIASAQIAKPPARTRTATSAPAKSALAETATAAKPATAPASCSCPPIPQNVTPYTIKQQTTRVQTLADGTTITTVETIINARDAEGRIYGDQTRTVNGDVIHMLSIFDYPTQTRYTWTVGPNYPRIVNVYRPRPAQPRPQQVSPSSARRYYPTRSESLPPQTVDGIYVEGTRFTRTIPAGYEGNDHDLVATTESWSSPELGRMIRQVIEDPRNGKTTTEAIDIQRSADPALFEPPAEYPLRENNPQ